MADQWHYSKDGQSLGPVSEDQLRQMLQSGELQSGDLVWKQGMAQWTPAGQVFGSATAPSSPPPVPPSAPSAEPMATPHAAAGPAGAAGNLRAPPDFARLKEQPLLLGYLAALAIVVIAVFLPWYSVSIGGATLMGQTIPSASGSVSGIKSAWGVISLLASIGGIVFALFNPAAALKANTKYVMAGIGGLVALCVIIFIAQVPSVPAMPLNNVSAGTSFGAYLTLLAGIAAAVLGYMADWDRVGEK